MITDRIGQHEVLLPTSLFKIKTQEIPRLFLLGVKKKSHLSALDDAYGPIKLPVKAEIRAVDSQ